MPRKFLTQPEVIAELKRIHTLHRTLETQAYNAQRDYDEDKATRLKRRQDRLFQTACRLADQHGVDIAPEYLFEALDARQEITFL